MSVLLQQAMSKAILRYSSGFVLAFHDILPERLDEFVESIRPAKAVPLTELVGRSKRGASTAGLFAITVDDGEIGRASCRERV